MALPERDLTKDGLEMQIGTNHFGHFLLTILLVDMMKASAPARIINVSSVVHAYGKINRDDLLSEKSYSSLAAYNQSKLANVLFTRELAKRLHGTNVTANSLHPGVVATELFRNAGYLNCATTFCQMFIKTPKSGAQTQVEIVQMYLLFITLIHFCSTFSDYVGG